MVYTIDYGHCLKGAVGARGCGLDEEKLTREIGRLVTQKLRSEGHIVHEVYVDECHDMKTDLNFRVNKINSIKPDMSISIHINCFSDPSANGVEVWVDNYTKETGDRICTNIAGEFKLRNRGTKNGVDSLALVGLYGGITPALLVECFFISNANDAAKYNAERYAEAIVAGVLNRDMAKPHEAKSGYLNVKPFMNTWGIYKDDKSFETWNRLVLLGCENGISLKILDNPRKDIYFVETKYGNGYSYAPDNNNTTITSYAAYEISEPTVKGYDDFRWNASANGTEFANNVSSDELVKRVQHQLKWGYYDIKINRTDL